MELILTRDVPSLGIANEVVRVKSGYARNYLLPNGFAVIATAATKLERADKIKKALQKKQERLTQAQELAERMSRLKISFVRKSSEEGRLFGSVTKDDLVEALKTEHHIEIDRKLIHLPVALKVVGEHPIKVRLDTGVSALLTVLVEAEGGVAVVAPAPVVVQEPVKQEEA